MDNRLNVVTGTKFPQYGSWKAEGEYAVITKASESTVLKRYKGTQHPSLDTLIEVAILTRCKHENIIGINSLFIHGETGEIAIIMPLAICNLDQWLIQRVNDPYSDDYREAKSMSYQLLLALDYLHSIGITHGDIKPNNILIDKGDIVKLCDFGLSVFHCDDGVVTSGEIGSLYYRPPEAILKSKPKYSYAIDTWSAALVIWEIFELETIFDADEVLDQLNLIFSCLGSPTANNGGWMLNQQLSYSLEGLLKHKKTTLLFDRLKEYKLELLIPPMLLYDPEKRPSINSCLQNPLFDDIRTVSTNNNNNNNNNNNTSTICESENSVGNLNSKSVTNSDIITPIDATHTTSSVLANNKTSNNISNNIVNNISNNVVKEVTKVIKRISRKKKVPKRTLSLAYRLLESYGSLSPEKIKDVCDNNIRVAIHLLNFAEYMTNPTPVITYDCSLIDYEDVECSIEASRIFSALVEIGTNFIA